jgi:tetratricopeptide (TPR) repeat protein
LLESGIEHAPLRLEIAMLFHTTFGNLEEGAAAARHLLNHRRMQSVASASARYLRFAAIPLRAMGCIDEAEALVLEALEIARAGRLDYAEYGAAVHLANIAIAANNPVKALNWYETAMKITVTSEDPLVAFDRTLVGIRAYLALGEVTRAEKLFRAVQQIQVKDDLYRSACYTRALALRMAIATGSQPVRVEVEALLSAFVYTRSRLSQDFCASALVRSLTAADDPCRARQVYNDYVTTYRRDRTQLLTELVEAGIQCMH